MSSEIHEGPLAPAPAAPARKLTWREQRWQRRRKRRLFEEVLGWILVPLILIGCWWALNALLAVLGTSPEAVIQGAQQIIESFERRR